MKLSGTQGKKENLSQRKIQKRPRGQVSLAYNVSLSMTNDATSLVLSLQLSPLLSVPEDTNLNMIVQTYIEIYVALEDISIHLT